MTTPEHPTEETLFGLKVIDAKDVTILPTKIWVESDILGSKHVVMQHEGMEPFTYATFHYNYAYTSNGGTTEAARSLALALGASEPILHRFREIPVLPN